MLPAGGPLLLEPPLAVFCAARVSPAGKRLSGVLSRNVVRCISGVAIHALYAPDVSAIPSTIGVIWLQPDDVRSCVITASPQPVVAFALTTKSLVMPLVASAITA